MRIKISLAQSSLIVAMQVPIMLLSGCGSEDDNLNPPVVALAPVSAVDGFDVIAPDEPGYVDLSYLIESGTAGANVTRVQFESSQGSGQCGLIDNSGSTNENVILGLGFNVTIDGTAICEYTYEVESVAVAGEAKTSASATIMVASSADGNAVLPPISIAMAIDDPVLTTNIQTELGDDFPTGYVLSEDFSVLGDGIVEIDTANFTVSYTPTAEGVSRVVYSLEGEVDGVADIKMGTLDYAISDSLNNGPTAENFNYGTRVEIGEEIEIDVIDHISDDDDEVLQLIDVNSYTAVVASMFPDDLTNTVFTFVAPTNGEHYVSYTVSDHRGGFATGIVEVESFNVDQDARWSDIEDGLLLFTAPRTQQEIDESSDIDQGTWLDTGYTPSIKMATFTSAGAEFFCSTHGRLPTAAEMDDLFVNQSPSGEPLWPTGKDYITLDGTTSALYSLLEGEASIMGTDLYYVTCIDVGGLVLNVDKDTAIANGIDNAQLSVSFDRDTGPVEGAVLDIGVSDSTAIPSDSTVTTDSNGEASFTVTNTVSGITEVSIEYTNSSSEIESVSSSVTFIADFSTAEVKELRVESDLALADGISSNQFQAEVLDAYLNPVQRALITVSSDQSTAKLVEGNDTLLTDIDGLVTFNITDTKVEKVNTTASYTTPDDSQSTELVGSSFVDIFEHATYVVTHNNTANTGDDVHYNAVLLTLMDGDGEPRVGNSINFVVSGDAWLEEAKGITDSNGQITVKIYDTSIETVDVTATSDISPSSFSSLTASVTFSKDLTEDFVTTEQTDGDAYGANFKNAAIFCGNYYPSTRLPTAAEFTALMNQSLGSVLDEVYGWPSTSNVFFLNDNDYLGNMNIGLVVANTQPNVNRFVLCHVD